ncbi:MAG TPA: trigger factor [Anaerohalosphaeraceae bacterium]|nr:trigger factor [Anaerohalosphaeraceae bacterium]HOL31937.1 trigger factor [Anaerohalosphaeraceae bacterium]HOM75899.1 trigger factor [Anaerohalosphaeraceae bacterium]HPC63730.1 trigger factor [Anaerohalosphaeraceae bacterium]HPO69032.1 trigger factor [Anaerohalosphaeraceae bacterium]
MAQENTQTTEETKEKIPNVVTVSDAGPCKKKVAIEIPAEVVHEKLDEKYKELRKEAILPGFRKGRAPIRLLEKRFGTDISRQVKLELMAEASEAALKDNKIDALRDPDIDHEKVELPEEGPMKFEFEVEVRPEFDLPELEGIEIEKPKIDITDARVEEELMSLRKQAGVWIPKDGPAAEGDRVVADVILVTEGSPEHDKYDNIEISVRRTGFVGAVPVDGLDALLVGAVSGTEKKTTVEVPATFYNEQYRGKKVDLTITVKEVKKLEPAEMNSEFFSRFSVSDENELKENIREQLSARAERQARAAMSEQVYAYLRENTDFELPEAVVAEQSLSILQRQYTNMLMQGMTRQQIDEQMEQLKAGSEEHAADQLKLYFILDKIADKYGITATEEEINGHIAYVAALRGRRPEKMREELIRDGSLAQFALQVREEKCIAKILETAKIREVEPEKLKKPAPKKSARKPARKKETGHEETEVVQERKKTESKRSKKADKTDE